MNVDQNAGNKSFTKSFYEEYGIIKKFIVIVFLPLVPIYLISKRFQERARKKGNNPRLIKYELILAFIYVITFYPLFFTIFWFFLQTVLFPISFFIALLIKIVHRTRKKDSQEQKIDLKGQEPMEELEEETIVEYEQPQEKPIEDAFEFEVDGFRKFSKTFIFLVILSLLLSEGGAFFIFGFVGTILIVFPRIYKKLFFLPKNLLLLSDPVFSFLSIIPFVNFNGTWFIEENSEKKELKSIKDVFKFIFNKWQPIFLLNVGVSALAIRAILWVRGDPPGKEIFSNDVLSNWGIFFIFVIVPIILCVYFVIVFVWDDAELKIAFTKKSTKGSDKNNQQVEETTRLLSASDSINSIFTLAFGIPSLTWLVNESYTRNPTGIHGTAGVFVILLVFFIFTGGLMIMMAIMYYRSGSHAYLVNRLRAYIKEKSDSTDENIKVCYSSIRPLLINTE